LGFQAIVKSSGQDVSLEFLDSDEQSLLALQGPRAAVVLQSAVGESIDLSKLYFMDSTTTTVCGVPDCRVTRCGYTGEDGFEVSVPSDRVEAIAEAFVAHDDVKLAGLGARDTLRHCNLPICFILLYYIIIIVLVSAVLGVPRSYNYVIMSCT
jgi:aminomethyltransferase